ncbi:sporulation phosphorelay system protein KapB [Cohnella yongneupensis]|uniref:Sporulation phosphorelay system protein KapB n=1 Tax=Cohnella yongneupensis TaxID=425006 RepID=A0ABW0R0J6_9BACL
MENGGTTQEIVKVTYKTGDYAGEVVDRDERRILVKILSVLKHPTQGDLHHPYDPDVPLFHERRALAYTEKVWIPRQGVEPYRGEVIAYADSLKRALGAEIEQIDRLNRWSARCLEQLDTLRKDYGY